METVDELAAFLTQATADGVRGRLQARGEARSIIRRDGVLPDDAPAFGETIDTDLSEYALSVLRASMALREGGGNDEIWRRGFARAGNAFEALVQNGSHEDVGRGFYRIAGAAAYHLASYSALAFSLISQRPENANLSPAEEALAHLILRDLAGLGRRARAWLLNPAHGDANISQALRAGEIDSDDAVRLIATSTIFRALAFFEFALQTGAAVLIEESRSLLRRAISLARNANAVSLWWTARIAFNLVDDLWSSSLHQVLPLDGPAGAGNYQDLRQLFIGELFGRDVAEVELWPSQIEAARRATDDRRSRRRVADQCWQDTNRRDRRIDGARGAQAGPHCNAASRIIRPDGTIIPSDVLEPWVLGLVALWRGWSRWRRRRRTPYAGYCHRHTGEAGLRLAE
ncbi:MAG: hypothetical protein C207_07134 [Bradyrhizobium sp. DFCI-1]|nr:MAG: hypothetical protein C207_07134 [Bradyrhizobium sp. DFCI-1]MDH6264571.1 hypothetical protein [Bradyrhizobium sp. BR13661]